MFRISFSRPRLVLVITAVLAALAVGCGRQKPTTEVQGKVTYNDKPVTAGMLKFVPDSGEPVQVSIGIDGTYRATDLPPGKYRVAVETLAFRNLKPPPPNMKVGGGRPVYVPIPGKYEKPDTSGLTYTAEQKKDEWNIELR
jgi:hypothetical protein